MTIVNTFVGGPTAIAATTVKLKNNKLVHVKTRGIVKGYKDYIKTANYRHGV